MTYWVTFTDGFKGCVETFGEPLDLDGEQMKEHLINYMNRVFEYSHIKDHGLVTDIQCLPYPASPRLVTVSYHKSGACPSFCMHPNQCAGKSSCPRSYSCVD